MGKLFVLIKEIKPFIFTVGNSASYYSSTSLPLFPLKFCSLSVCFRSNYLLWEAEKIFSQVICTLILGTYACFPPDVTKRGLACVTKDWKLVQEILKCNHKRKIQT